MASLPSSLEHQQQTKNQERIIQDLISKKHFAQAELLLRNQLATEPDNPQLLYLLGVFYYFQGELNPTLEALKKALSIDPQHTNAAICLSVLLNDIGRYDEAKKVFEQANQSVLKKKGGEDSEIDKKFAVKHLELADMYFRYRRYDEAIEDYTKALRLDHSLLDVPIRRAKAYAKKGFMTRALQELQQLKQEHPDYLPARIQLGLLHYSQENLLDAELEWETLLQLHPENQEAKTYLEMAQKSRSHPHPTML